MDDIMARANNMQMQMQRREKKMQNIDVGKEIIRENSQSFM